MAPGTAYTTPTVVGRGGHSPSPTLPPPTLPPADTPPAKAPSPIHVRLPGLWAPGPPGRTPAIVTPESALRLCSALPPFVSTLSPHALRAPMAIAATPTPMALLPGLWHWPPRWEQASQPSVTDLALVPFFALLFPTLRFFLDRFVFERMGRTSIAGLAPDHSVGMLLSEAERQEKEKKLIKFKESAWKCVYYTTAELLALAVTYNEPWFTQTKWFYLGPGDQIWPYLSAKLKLKVLYAFSSGFYTYSIFALCFWETRRKDFGVSMTHHLGTLALLIVSYVVNLQRAGSVILAVHDASDVFLEIGKLTKYSGLDYVPEIAFALFAISWVLLRLLYFPIVLIRSTTYECLQVLDKDKYTSGPYLYYILNTLLICLLVLHIYWWLLIWRMIMKQIRNSGKVSEDVRSDSDSDDEDKDKTD